MTTIFLICLFLVMFLVFVQDGHAVEAIAISMVLCSIIWIFFTAINSNEEEIKMREYTELKEYTAEEYPEVNKEIVRSLYDNKITWDEYKKIKSLVGDNGKQELIKSLKESK